MGYILEYYGDGVKHLSLMDRHVIANMGAELGATTTVFPSDELTRAFLKDQGREGDWVALQADQGATYDKYDEIDLATVEPLIAKPGSPGNVVRVADIAGAEIYQAYIGSSANPGYRDFAIVAEMVKNRTVKSRVSLDVNPSSRTTLEELVRDGHLGSLIHAGARLHQAGCNGCIGMGQAPATDTNSLRTVPRNFPGRSGTQDDKVFLCSPETAAASALMGVITDPRTLDFAYPKVKLPKQSITNHACIDSPLPLEQARKVMLIKGPNIVSLTSLMPLPTSLALPVFLKVGDNISTDDILPAGAEILSYRSNIPKISEYTYIHVDGEYAKRAKEHKGDHAIIGGENYGQGSSREHAALAPRYLGLRVVIALSFARIHWQNLINFGILPLVFKNAQDYSGIQMLDTVKINHLPAVLNSGTFEIQINERVIEVEHTLSVRQKEILSLGGLINWVKKNPAENHGKLA